MRKINTSLFFIFLFVLQAFFTPGQSFVSGKLLNQTGWNTYFTTTLHLNNAETIITKTQKSDIPFPKEWKYSSNGVYRLYSFTKGDYLFIPSNNGIGTYLMFIDHADVKKSFLEMNFIADSITCLQLPYNITMFRLTNSEFIQKSDTLTLNRYLFTGANGQLSSKAILTHGFKLQFNSIDTLHHTIYFNIEYPNHTSCKRCLHFNYQNNLLESDASNVSKIKGKIGIDEVHWISITNFEGKQQ